MPFSYRNTATNSLLQASSHTPACLKAAFSLLRTILFEYGTGMLLGNKKK